MFFYNKFWQIFVPNLLAVLIPRKVARLGTSFLYLKGHFYIYGVIMVWYA